MGDRMDFSIESVRAAAAAMRESNSANRRNKQAFLEYIDGALAPEWNTEAGKAALDDLRGFVNGRFQEYIDYIDARIDIIDNTVIPALININNA